MFTDLNIRENLSNIYTYIITVKYNIDKFNEYSSINYEALTARGERCYEIIFKTVQGISDRSRQIIFELHPTAKIQVR